MVKVERWIVKQLGMKKKHLKEIIEDKELKCIFNVKETGLLYKRIPNKTLAFKGEIWRGGKLCKQQVTLLIGANMNETEKLPSLRHVALKCKV